MEPILRSAQVLKQDAEELGYESKGTAEYVRRHQALDREDRAAWRNLWMAEVQAEEKKRADEIQMAQIEAAKDQGKI